jgi:hypothetical protein
MPLAFAAGTHVRSVGPEGAYGKRRGRFESRGKIKGGKIKVGKINLGRVILGGLVAGVIIDIVEGTMNGVVLMQQWADQMASLNRSAAGSVKQIIVLNLWGFAAGILAVWLYAAIRPRFGAGPRTAMCAGFFTWATICGMGTAVPVILHVYRLDLGLIGVGYELVEMLVAAVAGAYFYKESGAQDRRPSAASVAA